MADKSIKTEKLYLEIEPLALIQDGTNLGVVAVNGACLFKVGQKITLESSTQGKKRFKVNRVTSSTTLEVGPIDGEIRERSDISAFTVADSANIHMHEQPRPVIELNRIRRIIYEEEPVMAHRNILVDKCGQFYTTQNPMPVQLSDGSIDIGTVNAELEVQLSHIDNYPDVGDVADSVQVGDGVEILQINPDGSINVNTASPRRIPKVFNIPVTSANTEENFAFPLGTNKFAIRSRDSKAKIKVAYEAGKSGTEYWTVNRGSIYEEFDMDLSDGVTVYFQTSTANTVVEILVWEV
jgi:hypothetical protein